MLNFTGFQGCPLTTRSICSCVFLFLYGSIFFLFLHNNKKRKKMEQNKLLNFNQKAEIEDFRLFDFLIVHLPTFFHDSGCTTITINTAYIFAACCATIAGIILPSPIQFDIPI